MVHHMNRKYIAIAMIILFACALKYLSGSGTIYPSGSYNFQKILAEKQSDNPNLNIRQYNNIYIDNARNQMDSQKITLMILSSTLIGPYFKSAIPYILLIITMVSIIIFFHKLFSSYFVGIFAALVFLSNSTFNIVDSYIYYYYLLLLLLIKIIENKKNSMCHIMLIPPLLLASYLTHASSFFIVLTILASTCIIYLALDMASHKMEKKQLLVTGSMIAIITILSASVATLIGGNITNDFIKNFQKVIERVIFYVSSYEKNTFFYMYIIEKSIMGILSLLFIYFQFKNLFSGRKLKTNTKLILSYALSIIPTFILLGFTNVSARTFDYFLPLFGALAVCEIIQLLKQNYELKKIIITFMCLSLVFVSIFHFSIPPRSLEKYDIAAISGLRFATRAENIFTDTYLANVLLSYLDKYTVDGIEFGDTEKYQAVYYRQDENIIYREFKNKNADYFIISEHSLTRGLDILNAPHFLIPMKSISKYDSMKYLDRVYSNNMIWIWKFNG